MPASIVDWAGRPVKNKQRAPGGGQYTYPHKGAWWDTLTGDVTPAKLIGYLKAAELGNLVQQAQLFDRMVDRDDRLQAVLETRKLAVTGIDRAVMPSTPDDARSERAAELVTEKIAHLDMGDIIGMLLDAVPKGLALGELVWEGSDVVKVGEIPLRMCRWNEGVLEVDVSTSTKATYKPIESNKYIAFAPRTKPGPIERRGLLRALSMLWMAKHWAMKDWAAFVEVFGMPLRLGVYPEAASDEAKSDLFNALQDLGSDSAAIIAENMRIEFPRAQNTGSAGSVTPMEQLVGYVDTGYAIRVLGQNLTTESQSGSGTLAGGAHENVRGDYKKADAKGVARAIKEQLFAPIVGFNLGWDYPVPDLWLDVEDAQDDDARSKVYVNLGKVPGMTFSRSQIREEFGLREPLDEEDTLMVPAETETVPVGIDLGKRLARAFAAGDDVRVTEGTPGDGMLASDRLTEAMLKQAGDEAVERVWKFISTLAQDVKTTDELRRRLQLAAPNLEADLEATGLGLEDLEEIIAQGIATSQYNGEQSVDNELQIQEDEGLLDE